MTETTAREKQVMLVTGASSGIGLAATIELAKTKAIVVMLCRDAGRGAQALRKARQQSGNERIFLMLADLGDLPTLQRFCRDFLLRYSRLDVLLLNAGVIVPDRRETRQGLELQFGVNHVGHFLLTKLLSERLRQTKGARVVVVSSGAHKVGRIHFDDVNLESRYHVIRSYAQSKLAGLLFARELSRRLGPSDVSVSCAHPGAVATNMGIDRATGFGRGIVRLLKPFFKTPAKGAETPVALALTPLGAHCRGEYFVNGKPARPSRKARDDQAARRLWDLSEKLVAPWLDLGQKERQDG